MPLFSVGMCWNRRMRALTLWCCAVCISISLLLGAGTVAADTDTPHYTYFVPVYYVPAPHKLGLAGGTVEQAATIGASWLYDWTANPPHSDAPVEAVPMLARDWGDRPVPQVGGNSPYILGFNEPDLSSQANLTPQRAAVLWRRIEQAYPHRLVVSPAVSCGDLYWLVRFRLAYRELYGTWPRFDVLAAHCYRWNAAGCIQVAQQFATWVRDWQVPGGYWFTEFAFVPAWAADAEREARAFVAYLEGDPLARRYAPFVAYTERGVWYWPDTRAAADPSLFVGPGSLELTDVGRWYGH